MALAALVLALMMTSCGNRAQTVAQTEPQVVDSSDDLALTGVMNMEMRTEAEKGMVLERVKDIYRLVKSDYMLHGGPMRTSYLIKPSVPNPGTSCSWLCAARKSRLAHSSSR